MCVCNFIYKMIGNDSIGIRIVISRDLSLVISRELDHLWTKIACDLVKIVSHTYIFFSMQLIVELPHILLLEKQNYVWCLLEILFLFVICLMYSFWQVDNSRIIKSCVFFICFVDLCNFHYSNCVFL